MRLLSPVRGVPKLAASRNVHLYDDAYHRLLEGLARGSDIESSRAARAREDPARVVAELARDAQTGSAFDARPRQDQAQAARGMAGRGQRRERSVGRDAARAAAADERECALRQSPDPEDDDHDAASAARHRSLCAVDVL